MLNKDKLFKLCVPLETKEVGDDDDLIITGHASTNDEDRTGDIIVTDAWKKPGALKDYLKNPIVLAFHDMSRPIGKTIGHEVDDKGLKITAKISKAAGDIRELIKEGILSAFSVGFMIKDADWDNQNGIFYIKEVELFEVSVVSVPANQNALFSMEKNFSSKEEYNEFKKQFTKESEETLMDKAKDKAQEQPIDVASLAKQISDMVKGDLRAEEEAARKAKEADEAKKAEIEITAKTAAEKLIADLREEIVEKNKPLEEALSGLHDLIKAQKESGELEKAFTAENKGKMEFATADDSRWKEISRDTRHGMIYASRLFGKDVTELKSFKDFVTKSGMNHWDSAVVGEWESEYSTTIQNALREQLVVEPLFSVIPMTTPTMNMPINPEAGYAQWIHESAYGDPRSSVAPYDETADGSTGTADQHQLDEQTLIARKLATKEYIGYEEEEDSIVALAPVIRDAVSRRMALASDKAVLRGQGVTTSASYDPISGLEVRGETPVTVAGGAAWEANNAWDEDLFVTMRRNLGLYGLDPSQLVLIASHDLYYALMRLPNFKTVDLLGDRATIITGQVGSLFGVPVLVSQAFDNAAITNGAVGTTLGIMVRPSNFVVGSLRGIMTEGDRDIVNQKRVIVSSRRFAFQDIIAGKGTIALQIAT
jgi:HK97 family phage prohead protease/HK97 family phage major capsid protein